MPSAALSITGCGKAAIACSIAFILPAESRPMALWGWIPPPPILRRCTLSRGRQSELSLGIEKAAGSASRKRAAKFCERDSAMLPSLRCRRGADNEPGAGFVICIFRRPGVPKSPNSLNAPNPLQNAKCLARPITANLFPGASPTSPSWRRVHLPYDS